MSDQRRHDFPGTFSRTSLLLAGVSLAVAAFVALPAPVQAQEDDGVRWEIDPRASLAWWQVDPHYAHLWATTCPDDPSWQPGEGRSIGFFIDYLRRPEVFEGGVSDSRVPLYPRLTVRSLCRQAVRGGITVADTDTWGGVEGEVRVLADSLITGLNMRDEYARSKVLETRRYPEIRFTFDGLRDVEELPGDTIRATAVGTFELHGVEQQIEVPVTASPEEGGALRVQGKWSIPAQDLTKVYNLSRWALGMGVTMQRWETVYMGVDLLLRPETGTQSE